METRVKTGTVTFARPFFVRTLDRELPAGSYAIETEEEALEGVSVLAYRRVEIRLFIPRLAGKSGAEMWVLSPDDLDAALTRDRLPVNSLRDVDAMPQSKTLTREIGVIAMRDRSKGGNAPLYGALLGVLALLVASWMVGQRSPQAGDPPTQDMRATAQR